MLSEWMTGLASRPQAPLPGALRKARGLVLQQPGGAPVKLLQKVPWQEGEECVLGGADSVAREAPAGLFPVLVEGLVVGEHEPLLPGAGAGPGPVWAQQWGGFRGSMAEAIAQAPLPTGPG